MATVIHPDGRTEPFVFNLTGFDDLSEAVIAAVQNVVGGDDAPLCLGDKGDMSINPDGRDEGLQPNFPASRIAREALGFCVGLFGTCVLFEPGEIYALGVEDAE